jgi:hypothetical protein
LHYYQEKSCREIAELLGISYNNVRKRISQARAILREKLSEFVGEEDDVPPEPQKRGKSKKARVVEPAVGESLASPSRELEEVLPVESGEPVGAALSVLQGEPASGEASKKGELGIVAGSEPIEAALSVAPASFEALEEERLGIVAGGFPQEAESFVVPVAPACGEAAKGELGIVAGGEPFVGGSHTGRMIKTLCRILATPLSHLKAGCGTGGKTGGTPVLRPDVGASVSDGHLGQKEPDAGVREMRSLFGVRWRVWADSGGYWLSSISKITSVES